MGHHEQDLIETYLFRVFKGSGYNGLSSIRPVNNVFGIKCIRPFLIFNKHQIYKYAIFNKLYWCEDPTNKNKFIAINYIRYQILKNIFMFWPNAQKSMSRSVRLIQIQNQVLNHFIKKILIKLKGRKCNSLNIKQLLKENINLQLILIRSWLNINKITMLTLKQINHLYVEVILSKRNTASIYHINNIIIKKYDSTLFLLKKKKYNRKYHYKTLKKENEIKLKKDQLFLPCNIKSKNFITIEFKIFSNKVKRKMQKNAFHLGKGR